MRVRIDADRCTGHGRCYALTPELFDSDEYGHGVVLGDGTVDDSTVAGARRAADNCPEQAIFIDD